MDNLNRGPPAQLFRIKPEKKEKEKKEKKEEKDDDPKSMLPLILLGKPSSVIDISKQEAGTYRSDGFVYNTYLSGSNAHSYVHLRLLNWVKIANGKTGRRKEVLPNVGETQWIRGRNEFEQKYQFYMDQNMISAVIGCYQFIKKNCRIFERSTLVDWILYRGYGDGDQQTQPFPPESNLHMNFASYAAFHILYQCTKPSAQRAALGRSILRARALFKTSLSTGYVI